MYSWRHFNSAERRSRLQKPVILGVDGHMLTVFFPPLDPVFQKSRPDVPTARALSGVLFIRPPTPFCLSAVVYLPLIQDLPAVQGSLEHLFNIWASCDMKEQSKGRGRRCYSVGPPTTA